MHNIGIKIISAVLAIACLLTFSDVALCYDFIPVKAHDTLALDSQIRTAEFSAIFSELYIGHAIADACRLNITSENGVKDLITAHRSRLVGPAVSNRIGSFDLKNLQVRREGDSYYLTYTNALDGNRISCRYFVLPSNDSASNAIRICDFESSCVKRTVWMEVAGATSVPVKAGPLAAAESSVMDAKTLKGAGVMLKDEAPKPKPAGARLLEFAKKLESIHAEVKKRRRLRKGEHFWLIRAPKILRRAKLILDKDGPEEAFAQLVYMWKGLNSFAEKYKEYGRLTGIEFNPNEYEEFLVWWAKEIYPTKPGLALAVHLQLAKFSLDAIPLVLSISGRDSEMDIGMCALIDKYKVLLEEFYEDSLSLSESINDSTGAPNRIADWRLYLLAIHKIDKIIYNLGEVRQNILDTPEIPKKVSQYFLNDDSPLYRAQQHLVHVQHYAKMLQASSGENGPQPDQTRTQEGEPPLLGGGTGIYVIEQSIVKDAPEVTATLIRGNIVGGTMTKDEAVRLLVKMAITGNKDKCARIVAGLSELGYDIVFAYEEALEIAILWLDFGTAVDKMISYLRFYVKEDVHPELDKHRMQLAAGFYEVLDLFAGQSKGGIGEFANFYKVASPIRDRWMAYHKTIVDLAGLQLRSEENASRFHDHCYEIAGAILSPDEVRGTLDSVLQDAESLMSVYAPIISNAILNDHVIPEDGIGEISAFICDAQDLIYTTRQRISVSLAGCGDLVMDIADMISGLNNIYADSMNYYLKKMGTEYLASLEAVQRSVIKEKLVRLGIADIPGEQDNRAPGNGQTPIHPQTKRPPFGPYHHTPDPGDDDPSVENPLPIPKPAASYAGINEAREATAARRFAESYLDGRQVPVDFPLTDDIVSPGLGERVKKIRKAFGVSKIDFAVMFGVTQGAIDRWGKGGTLPKSYNMIAAFAEKYGIPMKYLLKGEGEEEALESANKHKEEFRRGVLPQAPAKKLPRVDMAKQEKAAQRFAAIRANEAAVFAILSEVPVDVMEWALPRANIVSCAFARRYKENDRLVYWSYAIEGFARAYRAYVLKGCDGGKLDPRSARFKKIADAAMRNAIADSARCKTGRGRFLKSGVFLFSEAFTGKDAYDDKSFRSENILGKSELPADKFDESGVPEEILSMLRRDGLPALIQSVDTLTSGERFVLARFIKNDEATLEKIAREMKCGKSSVFRIYKSAINKIQDYVMKKNAQAHSKIAAQRKAVAEGVGKGDAAPRQARDGVLSTTKNAVAAIPPSGISEAEGKDEKGVGGREKGATVEIKERVLSDERNATNDERRKTNDEITIAVADLIDTVKVSAYGMKMGGRVQNECQNIMIALEVPDDAKENPMLFGSALRQVTDRLERQGILGNGKTVKVKVVWAKSSELCSTILSENSDFGAPVSNIVVLGKEATFNGEEFAPLKGKAFFACIDFTGRPDYARILTLAMKLAFNLDSTGNPIVNYGDIEILWIADKVARLLPKSGAIETGKKDDRFRLEVRELKRQA
ncbi:MAG: helix-turn-helix domain-containing protein [Candidatus Omnitrophica bacterium]|nr:helix-turn-helix domain-containing protein [Candidatus Omnitrophota bacterium]